MIDFLITWVDGNDPLWQKERDRYAKMAYGDDGRGEFRFRDWDTLRYWFRGVEKFAPWVNNIFFVTCGHLPGWLDTSHPKLKIVKHSDFIPEEFLPTFNSNVIEFYFHKIPGLSERFVYFNDDVFLLGPVGPDRFFRNGLPCDIGGMTVNLHSGMFGASVLLSRTLINEHFNKMEAISDHPSKWFNIRYLSQSFINLFCLLIRKDVFPGFVNPHVAQGYLKSVYDDVWDKCKPDLIRTSHSIFRQYGDIAHWLIRYWQLASNQFSPCNVFQDSQYFLMDDGNIDEICRCIRQQGKKLVCLNDSDNIKAFESLKRDLSAAFEHIFPHRSSYELQV